MAFIEPTPEQIEQLTQRADDDTPIVMINLLQYREQANYSGDYPEHFDASPCSGREAYQRYGAVASRTIATSGGRLLWLGVVGSTVIGPAEERWDDAILVEYPSRRAFIEMVTQPEYLAAAPHRTAALSDSRLIQTSTLVSVIPD